MPQSLSQIYIHLVFSTKNRQPFISDEIAPELYAYMAKILNDECKSPAKIIGGVEDHGHILLNLSRTWAVANVAEAVKTSSSKWMKRKGVRLFSWQTGYSAFSVSLQTWTQSFDISNARRSIIENLSIRLNCVRC